ncbi:MAG TPA: hypothetical protein VK615_06330 [Candidatus Binatia bacterium]|nr:hypothetical protein [Candidatus Binatia bacterium]
MKHPNRDEWVPYIFGEARGNEMKRLSAHLNECAECAAELAAWRRSLKTLDKWELTPPMRSRTIVAPVFRWAVAAAIVLAAGVALGRMTALNAKAMRAEVETSVKAAFAEQLQQAVVQSETRLANVSQERAEELWRIFSDSLSNAREEQRQMTAALLDEQRREYETRYVNLRRDLETLAVLADREIQEANLKMIQLARSTP